MDEAGDQNNDMGQPTLSMSAVHTANLESRAGSGQMIVAGKSVTPGLSSPEKAQGIDPASTLERLPSQAASQLDQAASTQQNIA